MAGRLCRSLRKGDILMLTLASTAANQIIHIHQTFIMVQVVQTFLVLRLKMTAKLIHTLLCKNKQLQNQVLVSMMK